MLLLIFLSSSSFLARISLVNRTSRSLITLLVNYINILWVYFFDELEINI